MYPLTRHRRLRQTHVIRDMVAETMLTPNDFIVPLFVTEGANVKEEISSMPNYFRFSLDLLKQEVKELYRMGLKSVLLFVKVPDHKKNDKATEATNLDGLMQQAIKMIKETTPEMIVMTDVALDPFNSDGHDGIVENGQILNDTTVDVLSQMSLSHAQAGADIIAPSDMMDGRILRIRQTLDQYDFEQTGILAYSAKYASSHYGPFRDALDSTPGFGDKKTYQMDFRNRKEAVKEALSDQEEGADIIMVKPGIPYLDVTVAVKTAVSIPVAVYQVSGEYAMIKAASKMGWLDEKSIYYEQLMSIKRAGADIVVSYFAKDFVQDFF
jgi:porphobilinogen synthase